MSTHFLQESRKVRGKGRTLLLALALERQRAQRELGERIARHRGRLRLTQEQAAERAGVTLRAYTRWERGESMPYWRNLDKLAEALGVSIDDLIAEDKPPTEDQLDRIEAKLDRVLAELNGTPVAKRTTAPGGRERR